MAENRLSRDLESRVTAQRPAEWAPPQMLPAPNPQPGWVFRWIRVGLLGQNDPVNTSAKLREGWEPVKAADHPELMLQVDGHSHPRFKDNVEIGGLLLCKASEESLKKRREYYEKQNRAQMDAVDNSYLRQSDPRMPMDKLGPAVERKSKVTFGRGNQS